MERYTPEDILIANIDMQRGFMPAAEGVRLAVEGFGELPVTDGQQVVEPANAVNAWAMAHDIDRADTGDAHPKVTAHFGDGDMQWPEHCVDGTPGALPHPELETGSDARKYKKGQESIDDPADDESYSGFNAVDEDGESLGEFAIRTSKELVIIQGLALGGEAFDTCVDSSAIDFASKTDAEVMVVRDATRAIVPEQMKAIIEKLARVGVSMVTSQQLINGEVIEITRRTHE